MSAESSEEYITYISGGLFGDFFHQLSVINENYISTGKRGILYIANIGDSFRFGLENTYSKTYDLIINQIYIKDYKIYNNESYDINLSSWRNQRLNKNWYEIFSPWYNITWGKHKWLNVETNNTWLDKVLVNEVSYRFSNIDYKKLYEIYGNKLVFVAFKDTNYNDYTHFIEKTGLNIEYYNPTSVCDLAVAINSCKLFVGVPSGLMSMAVALNVKIIMGYPDITCEQDVIHGLDRYINNISYSV
jgi:hypothetical protein